MKLQVTPLYVIAIFFTILLAMDSIVLARHHHHHHKSKRARSQGIVAFLTLYTELLAHRVCSNKRIHLQKPTNTNTVTWTITVAESLSTVSPSRRQTRQRTSRRQTASRNCGNSSIHEGSIRKSERRFQRSSPSTLPEMLTLVVSRFEEENFIWTTLQLFCYFHQVHAHYSNNIHTVVLALISTSM